jgi:hypothetical protein
VKRVLLYGGVGLALFASGMWLGARRKTGALGFSDYAVDVPPKLLRAERQIAKAMAGSWLTDYRKADDNATFLHTPPTNAEALASAAYWMAVAARLAKSRTLAGLAQAQQVKANLTYSIPGSRWLDGSVSSILSDAATAIRPYATTNRGVQSVLTILSTQATPGMVANAQKIVEDKSVVANTVEATAADIAKAATTAKGVVTGEGVSFWTKWGWRLGVGAALLIGLRVAFGPQLSAATTAVRGFLGSMKTSTKALPAPKDA